VASRRRRGQLRGLTKARAFSPARASRRRRRPASGLVDWPGADSRAGLTGSAGRCRASPATKAREPAPWFSSRRRAGASRRAGAGAVRRGPSRLFDGGTPNRQLVDGGCAALISASIEALAAAGPCSHTSFGSDTISTSRFSRTLASRFGQRSRPANIASYHSSQTSQFCFGGSADRKAAHSPAAQDGAPSAHSGDTATIAAWFASKHR
jgi:hypothetical protein